MKLTSMLLTRWALLLYAGCFLVLLALAGWIGRDQVFQTFQDPGEPFQTYEPPPGADYARANAWFAAGEFASDDEPAVFFVHPTTYSGGANWNAQLDKASAIDAVETLAIPNFAAPFAQTGALFVPRYRQASLYTFMNNREDSQLARMFAYHDIERAFDAFLERAGEDRPLILAGVGQGGLHVLGLLIDRVAPDDGLRARLVAAYVIGAPVPLDLFDNALASLPACETPGDVRCVFAYSEAMPREERRIRILTERTMSWTASGGSLDLVRGRGLLCVNPILSARSTAYASARLHRGGVAAQGLPPDSAPAPMPGQTGAQCAEGILFVEEPRDPDLRRPNRIAEEYRFPPYNLFYEDLRLDAMRRAARLAAILEEDRLWAPPLEPVEDIEEAPVVPIPDRREGG